MALTTLDAEQRVEKAALNELDREPIDALEVFEVTPAGFLFVPVSCFQAAQNLD